MPGKENFPDAVRKALASGVPCVQPFRGIPLLQFIEHGHVKTEGLFKRRHVLTNSGNHGAILIDYFDDPIQRKELTTLVDGASETNVRVFNVTKSTTFLSGSYLSIPPQGNNLARVGFKVVSAESWSLSFANGLVTKKSVNMYRLRKFLAENDVWWGHNVSCYKAVVSAIYVVTGEITFSRNGVSDTSGGVQSNPTVTADVPANAGWNSTTTISGEIVQSESDQYDWIIAIEYEKLGKERREEGTGNGRGSVTT